MRSLPSTISASAGRTVDEMTQRGLGLFIDGQQRDTGSTTFTRVDPFSALETYRVSEASCADVDAAVSSASVAQQSVWSVMSAYERSTTLLRIADAVERDADAIGLMDTLDNGKLFRETRSQAVGVAHSLRYAAAQAERLEGVTAPASSNDVWAMTIYAPYGVIGIIVPWNSPLPLAIDTAGPALAAGNTVVVKSPENAPASIVRFAEIAVANGLPPGVFNVVSGSGAQAGSALVAHPGVAKLVFTGGNAVGRQVAMTAAERFIPCVLELGGKSAQIVMPDADLSRVIPGLVAGVFAAAGQTCVAGGRALIHRDVYGEVLERMASAAETLVLGDPLLDTTQMGPLGSLNQLANAVNHVETAQKAGARLVAGGKVRPSGVGNGELFEPTVFADVETTNPLFREEVFGPVIGLTPFDTFDEAVALANDSRYGLASSIWTTNVDTALQAAKHISAGTVWVNTYRAPEMTLPSGGFRESGNGRLGGSRGIYEFAREKSVIINHSGLANDPFVMGGTNHAAEAR